MKFASLACAALLLVSTEANAQMQRSTIAASNGVAITVHSDEFAGRYEYTAPSVDVGSSGYVLVARVKTPGVFTGVVLMGSFVYSGDWRFYSSALFRGGEEAEFIENGRDVGSCRASRYSRGCTLTESFRIIVTPEQLATHARDGKLDIQVRASRTGETELVSVPVSYFEAVAEVSGRSD